MKRGKKYQDAVKAFDKKEQYDVADAISIVKKNATAKFDETIELHLRTGCDGRHAEQQIRGAESVGKRRARASGGRRHARHERLDNIR